MRLTFVLHKHNVYRLIKQHWKVQRKRVPQETYALDAAKSQGLDVVDANDVIANDEEKQRISIVGLYDLKPPIGENHPLYHKEACYMFRDNNVLLQGLDQALVLTNSVFIDGLPAEVESPANDENPSEDNFVQRCIKSSFLYDAEQKKLPVLKDPERPAWIFPRVYGITDKRRNRLLCNRLLQLCAMSNNKLNKDRSVILNSMFSVPLVIDNNNVQLEVGADILIASSSPLPSLAEPGLSTQYTVPDISPLHPLVSFEENNIYQLQNIFPLKPTARHSHINTAIIHYNETRVKNLYETPVTDSQVLSRSLVKSYAIAVAQARHTYGSAVEELQQPITVQTIQTDGQMFIFSILQLNTLSHTGNIHNFFWSMPILQLFSQCEYVNGKPVLKDYNPEIYRRMLSFYNTESANVS